MTTFVPVTYIDFESALPRHGKPVSYLFAKNQEKAPYFGSLYGQDIEPAGFYHTCDTFFEPRENYTAGLIEFKNPIVIHNVDSPIEWKRILSNRYSQRVGKSLSDAIVSDGYDGIISTSEYTRGNGQLVQTIGECVSLAGEITEIEGELQAFIPFSLKRLEFSSTWQSKLDKFIENKPEFEDWILKKAKDESPYFIKKSQLFKPNLPHTMIKKADILKEISQNEKFKLG